MNESDFENADKADALVAVYRDLRNLMKGAGLVCDDAVLVTAFIPSKSSKRKTTTIPDTERRQWMEIVMAVFGHRFIGATCIGGDHYGLYAPPKDSPQVELPLIVQAYAAVSEIKKPDVLKELGDLMFGMAHELNQWETMLIIDRYRFRFLNPDFEWPEDDRGKYDLPIGLTMAELLKARGREGLAADWPFIKDAWTTLVQDQFTAARAEVEARNAEAVKEAITGKKS